MRTYEEDPPQSPKTRSRAVSQIIKPIPAGLAALFVFVMRPSPSLFYLVMVVGLTFCLLGDIGMEIGLLPGLGLFMIGHISFITAFLSQSLSLGITPVVHVPLIGFTIFALVYFILLVRYLLPGLGKFRVPVLIYALVISAMLVASFLLWLTSGTPNGILVTFGATIFVISDSLIGIREFHHKFSQPTIKILGTYYLAIFLLSLNVLVYLF